MREIYDHSHRLQEMGYSLAALEEGGKRPIHPGWQTIRSTHRLLDEWFSACPTINVGIHAGFSGIAVADADTPEAEQWVRDHLPRSPWEQRSPRGGLHVPFYDPERLIPPKVNLFGIGLDTRGRMSQIVSSPSYSQERRNHWQLIGELVRPEELPLIDPKSLIPERLMQPIPLVSDRIEPVRKYISHIVAVSGQGGHNSAYRAACKLADAGLNEDQVFAELWNWNLTNAYPPFDEKAIRHKAVDACGRKK